MFALFQEENHTIYMLTRSMPKKQIDSFRKKILAWHRIHGRHTLLWRTTKNPYQILVSEIMLQQTQVDRVIPKYKHFLQKFPTPASLAKAPVAEVLREWKGLGYNRRALFLKRAAQKIIHHYKNRFPTAITDIESLPGVGKYTARAIAAFAFNMPEIFIETNIRRVFIHFFFQDAKKVSDADILPYIEQALWKKNPRIWYAALMDYGATELKRIENPNKKSAHYIKQSKFEGSTRYARSHVLERILFKERVSTKDMIEFFSDDPHMKSYLSEKNFMDILEKMRAEGLIYEREGLWRISPL